MCIYIFIYILFFLWATQLDLVSSVSRMGFNLAASGSVFEALLENAATSSKLERPRTTTESNGAARNEAAVTTPHVRPGTA